MASSPGMLLFEYLLYRRLLRAALFSFMWREARHVSGVPDLPRVYFVPKEGLQNTFTFGHYDTTLYTNPFLILHGIKQGGPKTLSEAKQKLITWISCCCKVLKNKQFHMKVMLRLSFDVITYKCLSSTGKKGRLDLYCGINCTTSVQVLLISLVIISPGSSQWFSLT